MDGFFNCHKMNYELEGDSSTFSFHKYKYIRTFHTWHIIIHWATFVQEKHRESLTFQILKAKS